MRDDPVLNTHVVDKFTPGMAHAAAAASAVAAIRTQLCSRGHHPDAVDVTTIADDTETRRSLCPVCGHIYTEASDGA